MFLVGKYKENLFTYLSEGAGMEIEKERWTCIKRNKREKERDIIHKKRNEERKEH